MRFKSSYHTKYEDFIITGCSFHHISLHGNHVILLTTDNYKVVMWGIFQQNDAHIKFNRNLSTVSYITNLHYITERNLKQNTCPLQLPGHFIWYQNVGQFAAAINLVTWEWLHKFQVIQIQLCNSVQLRCHHHNSTWGWSPQQPWNIRYLFHSVY